MPVQKTRTSLPKNLPNRSRRISSSSSPLLPSLAPTKKPETGRCTFLSVFRLLPVCSLCNNQHQSDFARKADFPSEAQFPRTMAMLTKRINLICGNPAPLALPWQLPGMFKCMLNGFGPGCEDTKLYGSNVQSQGGAGNEKWGMAIGC